MVKVKMDIATLQEGSKIQIKKFEESYQLHGRELTLAEITGIDLNNVCEKRLQVILDRKLREE